MDIVLTDPRVSRRHAVVRLEGARLTVEDLGSSAGTAVNGTTIAGPTTARGGRPGGGRAHRADRPLDALGQPSRPSPSRAPEPPVAPSRARPRRRARPGRGPPPRTRRRAGAPGGDARRSPAWRWRAFCLLCVWMPVLGRATGTDSVWSLDPAGFRIQGIAGRPPRGPRRPPDGSRRRRTTTWTPSACPWRWPRPSRAGSWRGCPLFLAAVDVDGADRELGLAVFALGRHRPGGLRRGRASRASRASAARRRCPRGRCCWWPRAAAVGGLIVTIASPLDWISSGFTEYGGFDDNVGAGGWLVVLSLAVVVASVLALGGRPRRRPARRALLRHLRGGARRPRASRSRPGRPSRSGLPDGDRAEPDPDRIGHRPHLHGHRRGDARPGPRRGARRQPSLSSAARSHSRSSQASSSCRPRCSSPRVATRVAVGEGRRIGQRRLDLGDARLDAGDLALQPPHLALAARARRAALGRARRRRLRSRPRGAGAGRRRRGRRRLRPRRAACSRSA